MMESYTVIEQETDKVKGIDVLKSGTYISSWRLANQLKSWQ